MTTAGPPERDALLARLDALERESKPSPIWKNTALVGLIGTLVAVLPPSLTAIREYYQTEREVRLSLVKYQHERTLSYLDRALNPATTEVKQAQVFRFLTQLPEDDPVHMWAEGELPYVLASLAKLDEQITANEQQVVQLELQKKATIDQTAVALDVPAAPEVKETVVQVAQLEVDEVDRKIEKISQHTNALKLRTGDVVPPQAQPPAITDVLGLGAREQSEGIPAVATEDAPRRISQWRLRIATENTLEDAQATAAKAKSAGATNVAIYRRLSTFHVTTGRYGSKADASAAVTDVQGYLDRGVLQVDIMDWCTTQKPREGYTDCS